MWPSRTLHDGSGRRSPVPATAMGWVEFDGTAGSLVAARSHNVASLTDNGVGLYTVTWQVALSPATGYAVLGWARNSGAAIRQISILGNGIRAGSTDVVLTDGSSGAGDSVTVMVAVVGRW